MNNKKTTRKAAKKIVLIIAAVGIILSGAYLVYDLLWVPYHFEKLSESMLCDEAPQMKTDGKTDKISEKYQKIKEKYPDFCGRIIAPELEMDFPVVQCNNNSYYLKHTIDGRVDKHGTLFADFRNNMTELDDNTVIYGHNMKDCTQFGMLNVYKSVEKYRLCPVITFNTLYHDCRWKVFAAFLINTKPGDDGGRVFEYTKTNFSSEKEFEEFYKEVTERSYIITDVDVKYGDKILTMSTCSTLFENSRLAVMARLVREGESEDVDTSSARSNPDVKMPSGFKIEN